MAVPAGPPILLLLSLRAVVLGGRRSLPPRWVRIVRLGSASGWPTIRPEHEPMLLKERLGLLAKVKKRIPSQTLTIRHQAAFISASFPSRRALMSRIGGWPK